MLMIMGMRQVIVALCNVFGFGSDCALARQFSHVEWDGLRFEDTIFPLFLFLAGVSFPFSMAKRLSQGASKAALSLHVVRRGLSLIALGLVYNGLLKLDFAHLRLFGVLQLIGFAWMTAAFMCIWLDVRTRAVFAVLLLVGSWLLFRFVGAPDFPDAAPFSPEGNLGCWIDRTVFGANHIYEKIFDPEGSAGFLPAIVTPMLGVFAGELLRSRLTGERKTLLLLCAAVGLTVAGLAMSASQPIVKALWSSSFVLVAGGYAAAMLAVFYWIVDVAGFVRWTFFFRAIGMNSITIYVAQRFIPFRTISENVFGGLAGLFGPSGSALVLSLGYVAICWLMLLFLYRKDTFLKV